jgi:hypothetical protein
MITTTASFRCAAFDKNDQCQRYCLVTPRSPRQSIVEYIITIIPSVMCNIHAASCIMHLILITAFNALYSSSVVVVHTKMSYSYFLLPLTYHVPSSLAHRLPTSRQRTRHYFSLSSSNEAPWRVMRLSSWWLLVNT